VRLGPRTLLVATMSAVVPGAALVPSALPALADPRPGATAEVGLATGPVSTLPGARVEAIEVVVSNEMARLGIPGLSVAIGHGGELVFANGYGFADIENFVPAKADTVYRLASISKTITAVVVLQLAEQGRLDLDDPIRQSCPAFPQKRWPVTARQLLSHQGGIRHYRDGERPMTRVFATAEEALGLFKDDPLEFEPDTGILYSTYGYTLLGCVIEGATGQPFADVVREAVFRPAGMTRTQPDEVRRLTPNRARGYTRDRQGALVNSALAVTSYKVPGGGLSGTAPDLARFGLALISGALLEPESWESMRTLQRTRGGQARGHGLGLALDEHDSEPEVWKDGGQAGVSTMLYLGAGQGPVVSLLANYEGVAVPLLSLARRIARLVVAEPGASR
jgi:serine beta-lactamase-like protein LACTB